MENVTLFLYSFGEVCFLVLRLELEEMEALLWLRRVLGSEWCAVGYPLPVELWVMSRLT